EDGIRDFHVTGVQTCALPILNTVPVQVPPLRERPEDIALLAQHFARQTAKEIGKTIAPLPAETIELLQAHHWPGNVRELEHVIRSEERRVGEEGRSGWTQHRG